MRNGKFENKLFTTIQEELGYELNDYEKEVAIAYADSWVILPFGADREIANMRNLNWHGKYVARDVACDALHVIGLYNNFDSEVVRDFLIGHLSEDTQISLSREGSVAIYIKPHQDELTSINIKEIREQVRVDEYNILEDGTIRLWWD